MSPLFKVTPAGQLGNQMFQYLFAQTIRSRVRNLRVGGYHLKEWNIEGPAIDATGLRALVVRGGHDFNADWFCYALEQRIYQAIDFGGYAQRLEYLPERQICTDLFVRRTEIDTSLIGSRTLVINIPWRRDFQGRARWILSAAVVPL